MVAKKTNTKPTVKVTFGHGQEHVQGIENAIKNVCESLALMVGSEFIKRDVIFHIVLSGTPNVMPFRMIDNHVGNAYTVEWDLSHERYTTKNGQFVNDLNSDDRMCADIAYMFCLSQIRKALWHDGNGAYTRPNKGAVVYHTKFGVEMKDKATKACKVIPIMDTLAPIIELHKKDFATVRTLEVSASYKGRETNSDDDDKPKTIKVICSADCLFTKYLKKINSDDLSKITAVKCPVCDNAFMSSSAFKKSVKKTDKVIQEAEKILN